MFEILLDFKVEYWRSWPYEFELQERGPGLKSGSSSNENMPQLFPAMSGQHATAIFSSRTCSPEDWADSVTHAAGGAAYDSGSRGQNNRMGSSLTMVVSPAFGTQPRTVSLKFTHRTNTEVELKAVSTLPTLGVLWFCCHGGVYSQRRIRLNLLQLKIMQI